MTMTAKNLVSKIRIVPTRSQDIRDIAEKLRHEDLQEMLAMGYPHRILWRSYKHSFMTKTAFIDGDIAAIWGVGGSPLGGEGKPWLVTTEVVNKVSPLAFARIYQDEVIRMINIFPRLANYVDASYTKAIRLLDIVGFSLGEPEPMGKNGEMFIKFEMSR